MAQQHRLPKVQSLVLLLALLCGTSAAMSAEQRLPMTALASGNLALHAYLGSALETDLLFDTGSGYVSLSKASFEHIEAQPGTTFERHIRGKLANGAALSVPIYKVRELRLSGECVLRDIEVAVFPHADRDILGINALRQLQPFTVEMEPPALVANC